MIFEDDAARAKRELGLDDGGPETNPPPETGGSEGENEECASANTRPEYSTDSAEETSDETPSSASASENSARSAAITLITSNDETLSKRIALGDHGRLVKDSSASILRSGHARLVNVPTAAALAKVLDDCGQNQDLLYGRFVDPKTQEIEIGTKGRVEVGQIPRTKAHFTFAPSPGWCLIDVDGFPGDPVAALIDAVPTLATSAYVVRRSTSFGIKSAAGETFPGGGWHISLLLARQSDVERFLEDLHKRLWLKGYGWIKLSAAGTMLERSPVDLAMQVSVQPIFEGAPDLGPGLAQEARPAVAHNGEALDSISACPPLSAEAEYKRLVGEAKAVKQPEADRIRESWIEGRVAALVARGTTDETARAALFDAADSCVLPPMFELHFMRLGLVTVADVLADPEPYLEQRLADPHEGPEYGKGPAILYREPAGLWIRSFAHGGISYYFERQTVANVAFDEVDAETLERIERQQQTKTEKPRAEHEAPAADEVDSDDPLAAKVDALLKLGVKPLGYVADLDEYVRQFKEDPLIEGLLDKASTSVLYGKSNVGKSFVALSMAVAVAALDKWAGRAVINGGVLYLAYEGQRKFPLRYAALCKHHGLDPKRTPLRILTPPKASIYENDWIDQTVVTAARARKDFGMPIRLIVIDTLSAARAGGGRSENDNDDMAEFDMVARKLVSRTGAHVMTLHHEGRNTNGNARGGYALEGAADHMFRVEEGVIKNPKQRDMERSSDLVFHLDGVALETRGGIIMNKVAIVEPGRVGKADVDEVFGALDGSTSKAKLLRGRILEVLKTRASEGGRTPYLRSELVNLVRREGLVATDDAGRKVFSRAIDDLGSEGVVRSGKGKAEVVLWVEAKVK
jgi:hypothetical protein